MPNPIPPAQRIRVKARDEGRCVRCGVPGNQWHHRRGRAVIDDHTHCTCNGLLLCRTCHDWVHAHPFEARGLGFIVSRHVGEPGAEAVKCAIRGWVELSCDGKVEFTDDPREAV